MQKLSEYTEQCLALSKFSKCLCINDWRGKSLEEREKENKRKEQMVEGLNFKRGWDQEHCREINLRKRMNDKMVKIQVCF